MGYFVERKSNATELKLVESSSIITHIRKHITLLSIQKEITVNFILK
jgi:hypothetical protein